MGVGNPLAQVRDGHARAPESGPEQSHIPLLPELGHGEWKDEFTRGREELVIAYANPGELSMLHLQNLSASVYVR